MTAVELFRETLAWLKANYGTWRFYVERDIVWTVQERLRQEIERQGLQLRVFNDYGLLPGKNRSLSADLVLLNPEDGVELAVEFKYEPSHRRTDVQKQKFPVVFWGDDGVEKDVQRIRRFVDESGAKAAIAVFIDEGGYCRHRPAHEGSTWVDWDEHPQQGRTAILFAEV